MRDKNFLKRLCCMMLSAMLLVLSGAELVQAYSTDAPYLNLTDFKPIAGETTFQKYGEVLKDLTVTDGAFYYIKAIPKGAIVYISGETECWGEQVYIANYNGKAYYVDKKKSVVETVKNIYKPSPKWKTKEEVKKQGFVGDVGKGNAYAYIYSAPDDSKPEKCYAHVYGGYVVQIVDENYNEDWMKIIYNDYYICYIKKEDVNLKDTYLIGAQYANMPYIELAKKAKLTYKGILKNYDKGLTKKEFCRLAVQWYKAMGNELPKPNKTSPFKDTKNKYVILAHQLGIVESTADKKFSPKEAVTQDIYNETIANLMEVTAAPSAAGAVAKIDYMSILQKAVSREDAIVRLYKALMTSFETGYLVDDKQVGYTIMPFDNQNVCLDVWDWSNESGGTIGLWDCKSEDENRSNQRFYITCNNGYYSLRNVNSKLILTGGEDGVNQYYIGNYGQKMTFEYNDDGSVCIRNEFGKYLDLKDGTAVAGGKLVFREKSGSSSQKFIFKN